jgi:hypothetical protein
MQPDFSSLAKEQADGSQLPRPLISTLDRTPSSRVGGEDVATEVNFVISSEKKASGNGLFSKRIQIGRLRIVTL